MTSTVQSSLPAGSLINPQALMAIHNLELRAKVVVEGFWNGIHRSPYHGFSVEFTEYRQYSPDDDPRYLDWKVYARSDRYFIKKFEDETNLRCHLVVDQSRSMSFGSLDYTKAQYAATLAATLAYFLYLQGDAVGVLTFDEAIRENLPARHRTGHLRQLMLALDKPASGKGTDINGPLRRVAEIVRKRGLIVLISDYLTSIEKFEQELLVLAAAGHEVVVFQTLDPAEVDFSFGKATMFEDIESGRTLFIDPDAARDKYRKNFNQHQERLQLACGKLGATFHLLRTDQALELVLFDFLRDRVGKRRIVRRGSHAAKGGGT